MVPKANRCTSSHGRPCQNNDRHGCEGSHQAERIQNSNEDDSLDKKGLPRKPREAPCEPTVPFRRHVFGSGARPLFPLQGTRPRIDCLLVLLVHPQPVLVSYRPYSTKRPHPAQRLSMNMRVSSPMTSFSLRRTLPEKNTPALNSCLSCFIASICPFVERGHRARHAFCMQHRVLREAHAKQHSTAVSKTAPLESLRIGYT